jgi:hypothetical protein
LGEWRNAFGIVAPPTVKRAALHEKSDSDPRTVVDRISFNAENKPLHGILLIKENTLETGSTLRIGKQQYSGIIKHKTAVESAAKTLHHEAVF